MGIFGPSRAEREAQARRTESGYRRSLQFGESGLRKAEADLRSRPGSRVYREQARIARHNVAVRAKTLSDFRASYPRRWWK